MPHVSITSARSRPPNEARPEVDTTGVGATDRQVLKSASPYLPASSARSCTRPELGRHITGSPSLSPAARPATDLQPHSPPTSRMSPLNRRPNVDTERSNASIHEPVTGVEPATSSLQVIPSGTTRLHSSPLTCENALSERFYDRLGAAATATELHRAAPDGRRVAVGVGTPPPNVPRLRRRVRTWWRCARSAAA